MAAPQESFPSAGVSADRSSAGGNVMTPSETAYRKYVYPPVVTRLAAQRLPPFPHPLSLTPFHPHTPLPVVEAHAPLVMDSALGRVFITVGIRDPCPICRSGYQRRWRFAVPLTSFFLSTYVHFFFLIFYFKFMPNVVHTSQHALMLPPFLSDFLSSFIRACRVLRKSNSRDVFVDLGSASDLSFSAFFAFFHL